MSRKTPDKLRSGRWFATDDLRGFGHRSRMMQLGYAEEDFIGKPVIGILNTWSEINSCHGHFPERAAEAKRGVFQAGGFALEIPVMSLDEQFLKPTSMLYRNMLAMETEETIRAHPLDGVVLMGGCDKTTPGLIMGALSAGVPFIYLPAGPMLRGNYAGKTLGSGSDTWKYWDERRAGNVTDAEWRGIQGGIARSHGTCMTMGTAATMMSIADALGVTLPGASSIPAVDANHSRMASACGRRIVDMVWEDLTPDRIVTPAAVRNAAVVAMATGCSTNAVIHLIAIARRAGLDLCLDDLDALGRTTPLVANIRPSGADYLMEDFFYAGGLLALMKQIEAMLETDALTVAGTTVAENIRDAIVHNDDVIRPLSNPVYPEGSLAVLRGNLCPDGAVIKPAACDPKYYDHEGPALVFDSYPEMKAAIDDEDLDVTPDTVLVLRNAGPQGGPGMPEWGMLPIPKALIRRGHRDMLRISDARMSGTSYGACVLHVAPESFVGGPLALLRTGDIIRLDLANRRLDMLVSDAELAARRAEWSPPEPRFQRGWGWMFSRHVGQADTGCDFDYLTTAHGSGPGEPDIF
ncbi:dihydroxy-acid dehydratase [Ponticoccus sp. SC2-23]|uniref:L-arabinonate dehydratase n=1 Tax=Alexandriicola marinus TaxID=2081710 RepID=UPI000FDA7D69|nr:L-arabinonate dehydratase [Alexandriicola marinus]MBM1221712.1 dihydroxy-acid dehydratase [Ponticoccus sp. SC6-9]MBM1226063.1 dihydroxy-acid dehydratase [Ponticoccus sp. SC6-15]MBM1231360.1 dihydroxy-acid dehydratase [Ponticoccus sp. SC6-38]MBM1235779.1 dihydroxy-acid dehydratase [Ponticoccus sp. SC6-45]MBM1240383.1 dihydroxy-acid dehydratase [Ponticoccus sp. SC6-49]MBM1244918.1 dihydroxy-acid dehydratase [Ponticoccus sp. SC2-64]MBM1249253.1 dihydroxy-acid dehydratase [Ponticoccus sp. SC6